MRSTTGSNLKRILLLTNKANPEDITDQDINQLVYAEMPNGNGWRVTLIHEITDIKFGQLTINGFSDEECEEILQFACTS